MTISIAAYCPNTGQLGIAISSSSIAVGAQCPWLLTGVGAVSSQNITLPALGNTTLENLQNGLYMIRVNTNMGTFTQTLIYGVK